ncbi:MAG: 4Fe-4S binding protein [Bacteroidales bacterium]|nr:4Fe-4S binding protein [Bacteroidales bacterium]
MSSGSENIKFHHALNVNDDLCTGCTHCMTVCPTQAIRITGGKARIREERCVDCGLCYKSCPVSAIFVEQDDFNDIFKFSVRVALIPSVLFGQFESRIPVAAIYQAIKNIGFTHVLEVENLCGTISEGYDRFTVKNPSVRPAISPYCPAIVRLIQVKFPSLTGNIIRVKPPTDSAAAYLRKKFAEQGGDPGAVGLFYVTPCASKIASVKSPVGETASLINGVINMDFLFNRITKALREMNSDQEWKDRDPHPSPENILWSLTRGESAGRKGRTLAVDGIRNVSEFLEQLEESEQSDLDFLELRACDESCAGGILICRNRFLAVERLNERAEAAAGESRESGTESTGIKEPYNHNDYRLGPIEPRSMVKLDDNITEAIRKMDKVEQLLRVLPGIDCGACGAPTCRALAEDIVQGHGTVSHCIFVQEWEIRSGRLSLEEADRINSSVWGEMRNRRSQKG